jgi:alpha-tubulin suppressor-like RCC1 family protein
MKGLPLTLLPLLALASFACETEAPAAGDKAEKVADANAEKAADAGAEKVADAAVEAEPDAPTKKIVGIQAAALSTCALMEDGTVRCWGGNVDGQLGIGKQADVLLESHTPVEVVGVSGAKKLWSTASYSRGGIYWLDSHADTSCAQKADGSVQCWGHGRLMMVEGGSENQAAPIAIAALANVVEYTAAGSHACAVFPDKRAKCWGSNSFGVLGVGSEAHGLGIPTPVKDFTDAVDVGCGQNHCCGLTSDGGVSCWGYGSRGQLGNGDTTQSNVPVPVTGLADATQLAVVTKSACALKKDGSVVCWGQDFDKVPVAVEGATDITQLDAEGFACGVKKDKTVVCWGQNSHGQLGDGSTADRANKAAPVKGLAGVVQVGVGVDHACALLEDNSVKCWGKNGRGQLGDGTLEDRSEPVTVVQLASGTLTPRVDADRPTALPTDGKVAELTDVPEGCPSKIELEATVAGKPFPFTVRTIEAHWVSGRLSYQVDMRNYDIDEGKPWTMPRGGQGRISFALEFWVSEKGPDGKDLLVQKRVDMAEPYVTDMLATHRVSSNAGIFDNHKPRFFNKGQITITHLDDKWVCGEIDLSHDTENTALKGKFAAAVPERQ